MEPSADGAWRLGARGSDCAEIGRPRLTIRHRGQTPASSTCPPSFRCSGQSQGQRLVDGARYALQRADGRVGSGPLPFLNGLIGHSETRCQFSLRQPRRFPGPGVTTEELESGHLARPRECHRRLTRMRQHRRRERGRHDPTSPPTPQSRLLVPVRADWRAHRRPSTERDAVCRDRPWGGSRLRPPSLSQAWSQSSGYS